MTALTTTPPTLDGVDPAELDVFLRVADQISRLPSDHPHLALARRATSALFKAAKKQRRAEKRDAISAADRAVIARDRHRQPGPHRRRDPGHPARRPARRARPRGRCSRPGPATSARSRYVEVDAFYHQLCPACARLNHAKRDARTDLTGKRALLTGGRAKIGMYIALRLLRDGAHTTITTRFPRDAVRRFTAMPDSADWLHRLQHRRHRPARPGPGRRARRLGRRAGPARHPDQQRGADRPPLARRVRAPGRRRAGAAARTGPLPQITHVRPHQQRATRTRSPGPSPS